MTLLLALAFVQLYEAPHFIGHLQDGIDRSSLIQHIGEYRRDPDYARIGTGGWFGINLVNSISGHASQAIAFPVVQDTTPLVDHRSDPNGRSTDVSQGEFDVAISGRSGAHSDVASLQILVSVRARGVISGVD